MEKEKKSILITIVAILTLLVIVGGATYAYFTAQSGTGATTPVTVTTNTTDSLTFIEGTAINLAVTQDKLVKDGTNIDGTTTSTVRLLPRNNITETIEYSYYVYFDISANDLVYTTEDNKPELMMKVEGPNGEVTNLEGLTYTTAEAGTTNEVSGFDITMASGVITIASVEKISASDINAVEESWKVTITFMNLTTDQQLNTGKTFTAQLKVQANSLSAKITDAAITNTTSSTISVTANAIQGAYAIEKYLFGIKEAENATAMNLSNGITGEDGYTYYETDTPTYVFTELKASTKYNIKIKAVDINGIMSNEQTLTAETSGYIADELKSKSPAGLSQNMEAGLYRFQGTSANNYICFGTYDMNTCKENTDTYMYRIIGIDSNGYVKIIKKEALNSTSVWNQDYTSDVEWPQSDLYSSLNGAGFLSNTQYVSDDWASKIASMSWKYGDNSVINSSAADLYLVESSWEKTIDAKIGLMYAHDYVYGLSGGNNCSSSGAFETCKSSWLYLWQEGNDVGAPNSTYEWTMTRYGYTDGRYRSWGINSDGSFPWGYGVSDRYAIRPVFYLVNTLHIADGSGTLSEPFILLEA